MPRLENTSFRIERFAQTLAWLTTSVIPVRFELKSRLIA